MIQILLQLLVGRVSHSVVVVVAELGADKRIAYSLYRRRLVKVEGRRH